MWAALLFAASSLVAGDATLPELKESLFAPDFSVQDDGSGAEGGKKDGDEKGKGKPGDGSRPQDREWEDLTEEEQKRTFVWINIRKLYPEATICYIKDETELVVVFAAKTNGLEERFGRNKDEHIVYSGMQAPSGQFCFSGNTYGSLFLSPRFEGAIKVSAAVQFQLIDSTSSFRVLVHSDEKQLLGTDYGVSVFFKAGKKKAKTGRVKDKLRRGSASKWVDRSSLAMIHLQYDPEEGTLTAGHRSARDISKEFKKVRASGKLGFQWSGVKFVVRRIEVTVPFDLDWAARQLDWESKKDSFHPDKVNQ